MSKIDEKYIKVKYTILPFHITKLIEKKDYAYAYKSKYTYIIGLRIKNQTNYNCLELEYNINKNIFSTREERSLKIPKNRELFFLEYDVELFIQYFLEEETDILKESYQIYSLATNEKVEDYTQNFFSMKRTFEEKAKEVYDREKEKKAYTKWTDYQKASYWAGKFHRWMRWCGEDGMNEVDFFEAKIFQQFRDEEPNIDALMPMILTQLATAWMFDIDEFFEQVNERLKSKYQLLISCPTIVCQKGVTTKDKLP